MIILAPPKIIDITIESNGHGILMENERVILKCLTRANPPAKILWNYSRDNSSNIIIYENQLLIVNFSRTTPENYQCIADNGIPPRDTRTSHLVAASKMRSLPMKKNDRETKDRKKKHSQEYYASVQLMTQLSFLNE